MPAGLAEAAYEMIHGRLTDEQRQGAFKPEVAVSPDAGAQDKLLTYTGRNPSGYFATVVGPAPPRLQRTRFSTRRPDGGSVRRCRSRRPQARTSVRSPLRSRGCRHSAAERMASRPPRGREEGTSDDGSVSTLDGGETKVEDDELEQLRAGIRGDVLTPADDGFDANPIYNAMHNRRPALKVRATGTADVVDTVNFARQRNLLVAVQGRRALRGRPVELRRRHRHRPHADAGRDRRPGVPAGLGAGRRGLGRRRPRDAGVRPRRARRRRVRDGRRRPHPRRRRGLGAAQVRAHHRQPPLGHGRLCRRLGPRGVRRQRPGPVLGAPRWRRQLRRGDPLRLRRPPARPDRGLRRRLLLDARRRRDPAPLAGSRRRRARRGHLGGGRDLDAGRPGPARAGPQPVVPGHRRRVRRATSTRA